MIVFFPYVWWLSPPFRCNKLKSQSCKDVSASARMQMTGVGKRSRKCHGSVIKYISLITKKGGSPDIFWELVQWYYI